MIYPRYFLYGWLIATFTIHGAPVNLFDVQFLKQTQAVEKYLIDQEGFTAGYFETDDQCQLHYLFKKRDASRATIICAVGFWQGHKEGMATLYALIPTDCNLLFFDARGRGKSNGFYYSLWRYGIDEYKDVQAAINFAQTHDQCPIILYGVCAGAFHAAHALCNQQPSIVQGLIMDSAWSSVTQVSHTALKSEIKKYWRKLIKKWITHPTLQTMLCATTAQTTNISIYLIYRTLFVPVLYPYKNQTDLLSKIHRISIPILYIHSQDDEYTQSKAVEELISQTQKPYSWWINEKSTHASHHLKHSAAYKNKLTEFINLILG